MWLIMSAACSDDLHIVVAGCLHPASVAPVGRSGCRAFGGATRFLRDEKNDDDAPVVSCKGMRATRCDALDRAKALLER